QDGDLLLVASGPQGFRSSNAGKSFQAWPLSVSARALAERDGHIYAITDPLVDGYTVARSADDGQTWEAVLRAADVSGVKTCVAPACERDCNYYSQAGVWPQSVCALDASAQAPSDAGPPARGGSCGRQRRM
ncbi:MAG TPA: hypothetical protein VI072_25455, partial [Polyangiaceae bacterium]